MKPTEKPGMRRSRKQLILGLLLAASIVIVLSGCGKKPDNTADHSAQPTPAQEAEPTAMATATPEIVYPYAFPLTGLGTEMQVNDRPVMVMVENQAKARPQTGLDQADIVYEILAEGEITRFIAVYQSETPAAIGPVRSIRPYFVEIGDGLDALIVHAGWSQDAMNMLASRKLPHFDEVYGDGAYYWRDSTRKPPHNLYTSIELIRKGAQQKKFREEWQDPGFLFGKEDETLTGDAASEVNINYIQGYYVTYKYDADERQYLRFMAGEPHADKESGEQLTAKNILICFARHEILDKAGRRNVDVFGPGKGYLVQDGKVREVTWQRKAGIIRPYIDGQEVPLFPGKTWVQIVPTGSKVEFN